MKIQNIVGLVVLVVVVIYTLKHKNFFQSYAISDVEIMHVKYLGTSVGFKGQRISRFYCYECSRDIKALYFPFENDHSFLDKNFRLGVIDNNVGFKRVCYVSINGKDYLSVEDGLKRINDNNSDANFFMLVTVFLVMLALILIYFFREK